MRYGLLGQNSGTAVVDDPRAGVVTASGVKEIPYDYVATFKLIGERGNRVQDVITVSTEGTFVAVSVGASFVPAKDAIRSPTVMPGVIDTVFKALFTTTPEDAFKAFAEGTLLRSAPVQFLYTIVDSGSGRELQNKGVHSVAGLGAADGNRPFRPFARPVPFVPRSTIRIEIEELSIGPLFKDGTLFLVLHGYKRLGE